MATMIIEGQRVQAASGETYDVVNPATGEVVDKVPAGGPEDVDRAAKAAAKAQQGWGRLAPAERAKILHKAAAHAHTKVEEIAPLLTREQGKTLLESKIEAERFADNIAWFADLADKVHGEHVNLASTKLTGLVVRRPIGVTGAIVPWNFPLTLAANKVAPSIAAGNCVVLKPSSTTPLSTLACIQALIDGGLPEGVVNVVLGTGTGDAIVTHPLIRKIGLTGSTPTGKKVMARAAQQLKKITLELGGSDPCIVLDDADLEAAAVAVRVGRFFNCGQACAATQADLRRGVGDIRRLPRALSGPGGQAQARQRPGQGQPDGPDAHRDPEGRGRGPDQGRPRQGRPDRLRRRPARG